MSVCVCVDCWCIARVYICPLAWHKGKAPAVASTTVVPCVTHNESGSCVSVCVWRQKRNISWEIGRELGIALCVYSLCVCSVCVSVCVCVNRAGGHHWQSLFPRMHLNTEARCYWRVCVSVLHIWGSIQPLAGARSTVCAGKTSSPITLGHSSCRTPGCRAFHTTDQSPSQEEELGRGQRDVETEEMVSG